MSVDYPALEFIAKRSEPDGKGGRAISEAPFFMDLRGSNATKDHVQVYCNKGYQLIGFHNVSQKDLESNENWQGIASLLNTVAQQVSAKKKPMAEVVKRVEGKING